MFLTSELEVLVDMEGIDSFLDRYGASDLQLVAALLAEAGAHEIADDLARIADARSPPHNSLLNRVHHLVGERSGYDADALEAAVARRMTNDSL